MHEMSLAQEVLDIIEDAAHKQHFQRVRRVVLEIGKLASVEPCAMRFCFDAVVNKSVAQGARLEIIETEGRGRCDACQSEIPLASRYEPCPNCGGYRISVTGGDAMRVIELEVE